MIPILTPASTLDVGAPYPAIIGNRIVSGLGTSRRIFSWGTLVLFLGAGTFARTATAAQPAASLTPWISADFDGDHQPDLASAGAFHSEGRGFAQEISLRFRTFQTGTFLVRTPAIAYGLVARDVDGDSDWDLVVEDLSHEPIAVLVNDGAGHFHQASLEQFHGLFHHRERLSF